MISFLPTIINPIPISNLIWILAWLKTNGFIVSTRIYPKNILFQLKIKKIKRYYFKQIKNKFFKINSAK